MHHLREEEELALIWLWENYCPAMHYCKAATGEPWGNGAPVWEAETKHWRGKITIRDEATSWRNNKTMTFLVKRKHIQALVASTGYGGALAKVYPALYPADVAQTVTVVLTAEGQRWADSPYLRSKYTDHPSHPDVKAAKAKAEAEAEQQATLARMENKIAELSKSLRQYTQGEAK
jgi:hypothetical protein